MSNSPSIEEAARRVLDAIAEYDRAVSDEGGIVTRATCVYAVRTEEGESLAWSLVNTTAPESEGALQHVVRQLNRLMGESGDEDE